MSMRKLIGLVALLALMAVVVPPAVANGDQEEGGSVSLYTAPMVVAGPRFFDCSIVNVSKQTRTVTILPNGNPGTPSELAPGHMAESGFFGECTDGGCPAYCVFKVQGGKHDFRAAACIYAGDDPLACLPAE